MTAGVQEAKEDVDSAMDALETLGVEVPEGSDVGDLAGLVSEVEVGGGGGSVETCTLTCSTSFDRINYINAEGQPEYNDNVSSGDVILLRSGFVLLEGSSTANISFSGSMRNVYTLSTTRKLCYIYGNASVKLSDNMGYPEPV